MGIAKIFVGLSGEVESFGASTLLVWSGLSDLGAGGTEIHGAATGKDLKKVEARAEKISDLGTISGVAIQSMDNLDHKDERRHSAATIEGVVTLKPSEIISAKTGVERGLAAAETVKTTVETVNAAKEAVKKKQPEQ